MLVDSCRTASLEPRVVILDQGSLAEIDVVELPVAAVVGTEFCYQGFRWRVSANRPRTRVLLAVPVTPCPPPGCTTSPGRTTNH